MVAAGRIGPNAITRVAEALLPRVGAVATADIFGRAGLLPYLDHPPGQMVDETEVLRLHQAIRDKLGSQQARDVAREAGKRTGDYLLAHRIPARVQVVLKRLPASWAARVLLVAIRRHAWTFAGSGTFGAVAGQPLVLTIQDNPMCRGVTLHEPGCDYYARTFECLFRELVHPQACVTETHCEAQGAERCRFEVRW